MSSDETAEPFTRYENSMYRLVSMFGAALIAVLGITGFVIGKTLDPTPPTSFFIIDAVVTAVLFLWYLLGMRCRLDVADTWVHIATKYGDLRVERENVEAIEADRSLRGSLQWSGRPLILHYRVDDKPKTRKAYGCLPNSRADQDRVVGELQEALGKPEDHQTELDSAVAQRLATIDSGDEPEDGADDARATLAAAVAERLATMTPEGEPSGGRGRGTAPDGESDTAE